MAPPTSLRQNIRLLPRAAWILYAGTFINRFGSSVSVFLVLYLTRRGFSPAQAGLAVAAFGAGSMPASVVSGYLADRFGRRETLILASVLAAAFTMGLAYATSFPALVLLSALTGLSNQLFRAPSMAMLADLVPEERRMAAVGIQRLAINAGFVAGPATAGFLADHSFFLLFSGDAASSVALGLIAFLWLPRGAPAPEHPPVRGEGVRAILADRAFLVFLGATVLMASIYAQTGSTFPLWVHDNGFNNTTLGFLVGVNGAVIVVLELFLIAFLQRFRTRPVIVVGFVLISVGFAATVLAHSLLFIGLTVLVWTAGEMVAFPTSGVRVANASPPHLRGRYQGAWGLSWSIGWTAGPALGSWLYQYNTTALWLGCGVLGLAGAGVVAALPDRSAGVPERLGETAALQVPPA